MSSNLYSFSSCLLSLYVGRRQQRALIVEHHAMTDDNNVVDKTVNKIEMIPGIEIKCTRPLFQQVLCDNNVWHASIGSIPYSTHHPQRFARIHHQYHNSIISSFCSSYFLIAYKFDLIISKTLNCKSHAGCKALIIIIHIYCSYELVIFSIVYGQRKEGKFDSVYSLLSLPCCCSLLPKCEIISHFYAANRIGPIPNGSSLIRHFLWA